jgi:hypothetical protein
MTVAPHPYRTVARVGDRQHLRVKRVTLVCLMVLATLNIWTGSPLLALWIGSRVQGPGPPSMLAVGVAAVSLGVLSYVLVKLLARLDAIYARVAGRPTSVRRHVPWLRSMRGERPHQQKHVRDLSPLETILIVTVVVVVALFEVWFFFYSPSPIDQRTGRDHAAPLIGSSDASLGREVELRRQTGPTTASP